MTAKANDAFDRLVDHVIAEALELLPDQLHEEIIIRKFGLRDGVYSSDKEIAEALEMSESDVRMLGRQALFVLLEARREGLLLIGVNG